MSENNNNCQINVQLDVAPVAAATPSATVPATPSGASFPTRSPAPARFNENPYLTHSTRPAIALPPSKGRNAPIEVEDVEDDRLVKIAEAYKTILTLLGEDMDREGLNRTPMRAAKAMVELTSGYQMDLGELINDAVFKEEICGDEMVVVRDLTFHSLCEHHLLPFSGTCSIGYIPGEEGHVLGLSKFPRILEMFAQRLQVQERLTKQVCQAVHEVLHTKGVICQIQAGHSCMCMRGIKTNGSTTVTLSAEGVFKGNSDLKKEFLLMIQK